MSNDVFAYIAELGLKLDLVQQEAFIDTLFRFYLSSAKTQRKRGKEFTLTMYEYVRLHPVKYLHVMARHFRMKRLHDFKKSNKAMVLSWQLGMIRSGLPMSVETAVICSRQQSRRNSFYQPGEKMSDKDRAKCGAKKIGVARQSEVKSSISETVKQTYAGKSDAEKAAINAKKSAAATLRHAERRAAKAASLGVNAAV